MAAFKQPKRAYFSAVHFIYLYLRKKNTFLNLLRCSLQHSVKRDPAAASIYILLKMKKHFQVIHEKQL